MPTPLSSLFDTALVLRPLTDAEQDKWPRNPPTFALCRLGTTAPVAFLHDDVLFDTEGNFFEDEG